jgi:hypothetical protein
VERHDSALDVLVTSFFADVIKQASPGQIMKDADVGRCGGISSQPSRVLPSPKLPMSIGGSTVIGLDQIAFRQPNWMDTLTIERCINRAFI